MTFIWSAPNGLRSAPRQRKLPLRRARRTQTPHKTKGCLAVSKSFQVHPNQVLHDFLCAERSELRKGGAASAGWELTGRLSPKQSSNTRIGKTARKYFALICDGARCPVMCSFIALPSSTAMVHESDVPPTLRPQPLQRDDEQNQRRSVRDQSYVGSDHDRQDRTEYASERQSLSGQSKETNTAIAPTQRARSSKISVPGTSHLTSSRQYSALTTGKLVRIDRAGPFSW